MRGRQWHGGARVVFRLLQGFTSGVDVSALSTEKLRKSIPAHAFGSDSLSLDEGVSEKKVPFWGVVRASHNTEFKSYPTTLPYVVSADGCRRIVAGVDAEERAVNALRRHASVSDSGGERRRAA